MTGRENDLERLVTSVHALTRMVAFGTGNETPAAQWRTLSILRDVGPRRLGELAAMSRVTQPGMTRLVGQMVDAGLVERTADATDSRATVISATPAGLAALVAWRAELSAALAPHFADLDDDQWAAVHTAATLIEERTRTMEITR